MALQQNLEQELGQFGAVRISHRFSVGQSGFIKLQGLHKCHLLLFYLILYLHSLSPIPSSYGIHLVEFSKIRADRLHFTSILDERVRGDAVERKLREGRQSALGRSDESAKSSLRSRRR
jgi:hypothetical protein